MFGPGRCKALLRRFRSVGRPADTAASGARTVPGLAGVGTLNSQDHLDSDAGGDRPRSGGGGIRPVRFYRRPVSSRRGQKSFRLTDLVLFTKHFRRRARVAQL